MTPRHFSLKKAFIAVTLVTLGAIFGDVVSSFATPSNSLISACVDRSTGVMRYLQKGRCKKTELAVRWNIQGPVGSQGLEGLQGPRGATGATGPQGPQGPSGNDGAASVSTVRSGNGVPANSLGNNGDFYVNTLTNMIHGPKAGDVWPNGVSLVGPTGASGANGLPGANGAPGAQGPAGQGLFSYVESVSVAKSNQNTDSILLANYVPIANVGSDIEISMACGYVTVSTPSIVAWSIAVKAPTGSSIFGHTTIRNDSAPDSLIGTALGTRQRLQQDQSLLKLTSPDFIVVNVFGPSIEPVVFKLAISIGDNNCSASGTKQTS